MLIFTVDSDASALAALTETAARAAPGAQIKQFNNAKATLAAIQEEKIIPHVVFSEIQFPEYDGLHLASEIRTIAPAARIVFVTKDASRALDAYRVHVSGYMLKPVTLQGIEAELGFLTKPPVCELESRIIAKCFGTFEVYWQGLPLPFQRHKSKELLAYLIDRNGSFCTNEQIICDLWENCDSEKAKHRLRNLVADLRNTLRSIGQEEVFIKRRNQLAIVPSKIDCDYYTLIHGKSTTPMVFPGEYMRQYSWAEVTTGYLHFQFGAH